jgi:hypothetical protein
MERLDTRTSNMIIIGQILLMAIMMPDVTIAKILDIRSAGCSATTASIAVATAAIIVGVMTAQRASSLVPLLAVFLGT